MKYIKIWMQALLAGVCIAIGGTVFLSLDNRALGALRRRDRAFSQEKGGGACRSVTESR